MNNEIKKVFIYISIKSLLLFVCSFVTTTVLAQNTISQSVFESSVVFDDSGWNLIYQENFDSSFEASHAQKFGQDNWLIFQLLNGATISVDSGYAQINSDDFPNVALIRSTGLLPAEYKIRTKFGFINYDIANYEQTDYDDPNFNTHGGNYENGTYFLTVTNDTCIDNQCAEYWWHYHRKMVIDCDNHINSDQSLTFHPVYMVYMSPEINSGGNLLRTWDGNSWDSSAWNWNVAYTYDSTLWYYAESEKKDNRLILRLYDANKNLLRETTPVSLDKIFAMDDTTEFLYLGEPHSDDYEGNFRIDEITLLTPESYCCLGIRGNIDNDISGNVDMSDLTYFIDYMFKFGPAPACLKELNVNGDSRIDIRDLTFMVRYVLFGSNKPYTCYP